MVRPAADADRRLRQQEILTAAQQLLGEKGYKKTSMLDIARRAGASKETLYAWFGDKQGLFSALIDHNGEALRTTLTEAITKGVDEDPMSVLVAFAESLLHLLTGERSVALNRAAISEASQDTSLSYTLVAHGRDALLPLLADRLTTMAQAGTLTLTDPMDAAEIYLGLVLTDLPVRRLLGVSVSPDEMEIKFRAYRGVEHFMRLYRAET